MNKSASNKELADAIKELFKSRRGEFGVDDLVEVLKEFELTAIKKLSPHLRGRMYAQNCFADIVGCNLKHALESYEWEEWRPMTDDGITVSGFWNTKEESEIAKGYVVDESGRYLKLNK